MFTRRSTASKRNDAVKQIEVRDRQKPSGNATWLAQRAKAGSVVFIGGCCLDDFRVRYAQSHFRRDLLPSFWSWIGIADGSRSMLTVPLGFGVDAAGPAAKNAIERVTFRRFDDIRRYPNVGLIHFTSDGDAIVKNARRLIGQRSAVDLPALLIAWLAYAWGVPNQQNPILAGQGLPGAVFVHVAFGMSGFELTPGLTSNASCPEAIWQAALWWHDYYEKTVDVAGAKVATDTSRTKTDQPRQVIPWGEYRLVQPSAAVTWEPI